jgi:hypothetical protein
MYLRLHSVGTCKYWQDNWPNYLFDKFNNTIPKFWTSHKNNLEDEEAHLGLIVFESAKSLSGSKQSKQYFHRSWKSYQAENKAIDRNDVAFPDEIIERFNVFGDILTSSCCCKLMHQVIHKGAEVSWEKSGP